MSDFIMIEEGPLLDKKLLSRFEKKIGKKLPSEYQSFLEAFNGGRPQRSYIDFILPDGVNSGDSINYFYEVSNDPGNSLIEIYEAIAWQNPEGIIMIAESPAGNYFGVSVNNIDYGQIFYKDHELDDEPVKEDGLPYNMIKIANTFNEFVDKLYDPDE